jgi:hypothetical protein
MEREDQAAMVLALMMLAVLSAPAKLDDPVIGFVNHYPMIRHMDDKLGESGANVVIMRAPWALIEPEEGRFAFGMLDEQLDLAARQGIQLVILLEAGPAHAANVPWLVEKLRAAGHMQMGLDGQPCKEPSPFSPVYRRYLSRYIARVVGYCKQHRLAKHVYGYNNGCEWWYPIYQSYGPLAEEAFQTFLKKRYGSVARLNAEWGADVKSWSDVRAPRVVWLGSASSSQSFMVPASAQLDACYATTADAHVPVQPGRRYTFTVNWHGDNVRVGGVLAEIAWLGSEGPRPIAISQSSLSMAGTQARCEAVAPEGAERAWLLAKSMALGTVTFTRVSFTDETGAELVRNGELAPDLGGWQFIRWSGEPDRVTHRWDRSGEASITWSGSLQLDTPSEWPLAAVADWTEFRAQALAEFMDNMAADIRRTDRSRPVVTYLTFSFANPFEWDYAQQMAVQLEHWAPAAQNQQILGMQLSSGEGDFDSVACALDMVRKYGKPMWAVDLLDFTRGTALGASQLADLSKTVWDHGGTGIQYYCWWGTPHYSYLDLGLDTLKHLIAEARAYAQRLSKRPRKGDVALVLPRMPLYGALDEPPNDWADFMGWYKLLRHMGVLTDVYTLEELGRSDLQRHRVVIVPDCAYLSSAQLNAILRLARRGVRIVQTGRFGLRDRTGRPLAKGDAAPFFRRFPQRLGTLLLGETYRHPTPTDTPPRLVCRPGYPKWESDAAQDAVQALRDAGVQMESASMSLDRSPGMVVGQ